jgi:hypothetical protein
VNEIASLSLKGNLISPEEESRAFWRLRYYIGRTLVRQMLSQARFRAILVLVLSTVLWGGLFWLFSDGFQYLRTVIPHAETHDQLVQAVFSAFFAALLLMLIFSAAIILYGSLFCSPETAFLLTLPTRTEQVAKISGNRLLEQLGICALGQPASHRLWNRGRCSLVFLCHVVAVFVRFCLYSVGHRGYLLPLDHSTPPEQSAIRLSHARLAPSGRLLMVRLVFGARARKRSAHAQLVHGNAG